MTDPPAKVPTKPDPPDTKREEIHPDRKQLPVIQPPRKPPGPTSW